MDRFSQQLRVGLQCKAIMILTAVVLAVTVSGGWFYYENARSSLRLSDERHATRLGKSLAVASQYHLRDQQTVALERLAEDFLTNENVRYVAILDAEGHLVASASPDYYTDKWAALVSFPPAISSTRQVNDDLLIVARPVLLREALFWKDHMVGAIRLVFDTRSTTLNLRRVQKRMLVVAALIVLCVIPLAYLLVWRVLIQPFRKLVALTQRLAKGDFSARAGFKRNDEVGQLATSFDTMAKEVASMRRELVMINEGLEREVAKRTKEIQIANLRLREEISEKEEFLRAVSHDLNAPLRNIAGMTTMIQMKWREDIPEDVMVRLERIQANVDSESSLIGELLELSRIRSRPQKRSVVDMGELLGELAATFEFELKKCNIELRIDSDLPTLYVEKNRIRQVFQNLIDNAIKYMDRTSDGIIEVHYSRAEGFHTFCVADNGPGIAPAEQKKIFQVFQRAGGTAEKAEGKGVGLAFVRSVMVNYDGRAWVRSQRGQGATFFITLNINNTRIPGETFVNERDRNQFTAMHPVSR
ncbi:MAG: sensor histidine kinase [Planctomycetota bacterium]|jgi:signal transduction histidine kinase